MNNTLKGFITLALLFLVGYTSYNLYDAINGNKGKDTTYGQVKLDKDIAEAGIELYKKQLEEYRVRVLLLQASLDSCEYKWANPVVIVAKKPIKSSVGRPSVSYKAKFDSTVLALNSTRENCAENEVALLEKVNLREKQLDTLVNVLNAYDKALVERDNENVKLTNQKDSLITKLHETVTVFSEFPCLKAKRGVSVSATHAIKDGDNRPAISLKVTPLTKTEYKKLKGQCKKVNIR